MQYNEGRCSTMRDGAVQCGTMQARAMGGTPGRVCVGNGLMFLLGRRMEKRRRQFPASNGQRCHPLMAVMSTPLPPLGRAPSSAPPSPSSFPSKSGARS